ncbi:proteobacterial dedicated sortase system histidine kinase [Teredinibacter turnerae]|uniref:proteobacterial dedicated sortase system histidine kinase n=1 Tax=Teredinibacter turnerae TaxID=2426 RepID=UPI0030D1D8FD
MKLRKQLLIVSLITLTLPWVGCRYIGEMEQTLRDSQSEALIAMSKAIAARMGSDSTIVAELERLNPPRDSSPVFAHNLPAAPLVDGYQTDWQEQQLASQSLRGPGGALRAQFTAGSFAGSLYLVLVVHDDTRSYYQPTQPTPLVVDHLLLQLPDSEGAIKTLLIAASGQGRVTAGWLTGVQLEPEYQLTGVLSETATGYILELKMPLSWAANGLGLRLVDQSKADDASNFTSGIPPLVTESALLTRELGIFAREGVRLQIATRGTRPVAREGELTGSRNKPGFENHGFFHWLYLLSVGNRELPALDDSIHTGLLDTPEIHSALASTQAAPSGWYQTGTQQIVRVAAPIYTSTHPHPLAVVVAEQSSESLARLTSSAFYRLMVYSILVTLAASLTLILYASWLSFRIRKLSRAAANAISDQGRISDQFPVFTSRDELGDLSRNYATLLARLREYTNYLRTLSSKLSHELRTPLAIVRSSLDNLEFEELSAGAKVYAERAREGTSRLSNILNAMSAASRVEQAIGAAEVELIPCDELLTNLKAAYEDVYQHADFSLNIRREDGPLTLQGSGELLVQMLDKLVDNAADFCPRDGRIELGLYHAQGHLVFTVHNEGPPLPSSMHGQLFDSMVSVRDQSSGQAGQHLGLGLYIVRLIVDFHRGQVHCYNLPDNSGVIFEIRLPAA